MTAGAASAAIGFGATAGSTFAAAGTATATTTATAATTAGLGNIALSAAMAGFTSSIASQLTMTGSLNWGSAFEGAAVGGITAGLTNGITYNSDSGIGFTTGSLTVGGPTSSLASLAGVNPLAGTSVSQASASTATTLETRALAMLGEAGISAGVGTAIEGGSLGSAFKDALTQEAAAAGAFAIGGAQPTLASDLGPVGGELAYLALHGALGCAAGAASGQGCGGGAIGGAVSAGLNPLINSSGNLPPAALAGIETLVSGGVAGALGYNVQGAVTAAQNETLNNFCEHSSCGRALSAFASQFADNLAGSMSSQEAAAVAGAPAYISASGSGMGVEYGVSLNLYNDQIYLGLGKANPISPSGSLVVGYLSPTDDSALSTDNFLNGGSVTAGGCYIFCAGMNHSIGGTTSFEFGIGTPGVTAGVSVSKPVPLGVSK